MKFSSAALALSIFLVAGAVPAGDLPPAAMQLLEQARRHASRGEETAFAARPAREGTGFEGAVYVFYNNPRPFCYTYVIPGNWLQDQGSPPSYRSVDGSASVTVSFLLARNLKGAKGSTLVERAAAWLRREYEADAGHALAGAELSQFQSARPGTWKWTVSPVVEGGRMFVIPTQVLVEIGSDAVMLITVGGTPDDDGLARRIIGSLRTTTQPDCYWPALEAAVRALFDGR